IIGIGGTNRPTSQSYLALEAALHDAEKRGAEVQAFKLYDLQLPMYDPSKALNQYDEGVRIFVEAVRDADGVILSTASYHGILPGIMKNAIDFLDFTDTAPRPYLSGRAVGLIATGASEHGASTTITSMMHMVQALQGIIVPATVPIDRAWERFDKHTITDDKVAKRIRQMTTGLLQLATQLQPSS
ncbi:MAG: NADPH-dependent FMN reductase, partial [Chloroflexota bacterium]